MEKLNKRTKQPSSPIKEIEQVYDIQDYLKANSQRNYILFLLGISTGYRAGDLVQLKVRNVRQALEDGYFTIMEGKKLNSKNIREKNRKPRRVIIIKNLRKKLEEYIQNKDDYEWMMLSVDNDISEYKKEFEAMVQKEVIVDSLKAVIMCHVGPGTFALGRIKKIKV